MTRNDRIAQRLNWISPLEAASRVNAEHWALLYSGAVHSYSGRYSFLCMEPVESIEADGFTALSGALSTGDAWHENFWTGYLGYSLRRDVEILPSPKPSFHLLPALWMQRFATIYRFDHKEEILERFGPPQKWENISEANISTPVAIKCLQADSTKEEYLEKVKKIISHIQAGDLYQANLTRKFHGEFEQAPDGFALFKKLCVASPAPYSAYLNFGDIKIISSSPELFLALDAEGKMVSRPIKGSAARSADAVLDAKAREELYVSEKDRAENLMIVDLMRNDMAKSSVPGSVKVNHLFEVITHPHIHHMNSEVTAHIRADTAPLDVVQSCFPPGSMTGAPKIRAMELCSELEPLERGVYSGAIGWFGGDGSFDLSVVIRTIVVQGRCFEFQVGGGIVADSVPEAEWRETMTKAKGMVAALGIEMERLEGL